MNASLLALFLLSLLPFIHSLSTFAISETNNQTLVCAIVKSASNSQNPSSFVNCTGFPQRTHIQLKDPVPSVSAIVGGNGFLCVLSSSYSSNKSLIFCWRFSNVSSSQMADRKRVYSGPLLRDLSSGNSRFCGIHNGTNTVECWPRRELDTNGEAFSSSLAVGEDFMCGLLGSGEVRCSGSDRSVTDHTANGSRYSGVGAGFRHVCGVLRNGSLECWGNMAGEMPQGEFKSVALAENRSCAIRPNGTVVCWGEEGFSLPASMRNETFVAIEAKKKSFCGVEKSKYRLLCWGNEAIESNPLVFDDVVPGPCRPIDECSCDSWPNYGEYCGEGLTICQPCDPQPPRGPPPLPAPPSSLPPPPPPSPRANGGKKWTGKMVAFMVVGCVGAFSSLLALCVYLFSRYIKIRGSRIHDSGRLEEGEGGASPQQRGEAVAPRPSQQPALEKKLSHLISTGNGGHLEEFSLEALLTATDHFSEELKIGNGSFGSVYHATLDDGRHVAVKRAETSASSSYAVASKRDKEDRDTAFLNELEFLSRLNHKNLVRLLGYCEESDELVLVYEYMDNGTLSDHLHKLESSPLMSWPKRIKVALDAARGIEYLHEYAVPRIIHRDIKSSNILLDSTWTAKVSDFGLSLWGPQDDESHLSLRAAGTMGYMDPEYYRLQLLTTKSDVYSFGVMLLELLSGCKAIHKNENGVPRNVVDFIVPHVIHDDIHRVLDRRVPPPNPFEIEAVAYVGYLAVDCVMLEGRDRPTMSEVVNSLDRALEACLAPQVLSRSGSVSST
ncbi:hypothetical protein C2S51_019606 [Perilla frutescens var. frutescens]|nr:hypothetical protein C2S51_019606 [Perilla frutescens var. frutescens]